MFEQIDVNAAGIAVAVLVVAGLLAWISKRFQLTDGVGLVALIILPLAIYGIASGYITKISGPGGWAAEFREIAKAGASPTSLAAEVEIKSDFEELTQIDKAGTSQIEQLRDQIEIGKPVAISLRIGRRRYYNERAIEQYIRAFMAFDPDLTVVFVEQSSGAFFASSSGQSVLLALDLYDYDGGFVKAIEGADIAALRVRIVLTTKSVNEHTTNAEALRQRYGDHRCRQIDESLEEELLTMHQLTSRRVVMCSSSLALIRGSDRTESRSIAPSRRATSVRR